MKTPARSTRSKSWAKPCAVIDALCGLAKCKMALTLWLGIVLSLLPLPFLYAASLDNIQVLGTVMGSSKKSHYAIIAIDNGEPENYKLGQTVIPGYVLDKILDDKITLRKGTSKINIKIGVPFSADDFSVESGLPPSYPESAPPLEVAPEPPPPPDLIAPPDAQPDPPPAEIPNDNIDAQPPP